MKAKEFVDAIQAGKFRPPFKTEHAGTLLVDADGKEITAFSNMTGSTAFAKRVSAEIKRRMKAGELYRGK